MPRCRSKVPKSQQVLIKVTKCLFAQYVVPNISAAKEYNASPQEALYGNMATQLQAAADSINASQALAALNCAGVDAFARVILTDADGFLQYDSAKGPLVNTYTNAQTLSGNGNGVSGKNYLARKSAVELNVNEDIDIAHQVKPAQSNSGLVDDNELKLIITESGVWIRSGCCGVSNTGYIRLTIEVNIECFPFNPCSVDPCLDLIPGPCKK